MKQVNFIVGCVLGCMAVAIGAERDRAFDADWRFLRGDAPGAEQAAFDDSGWRTLDVPHDWSIEDLPPKAVPELDVITGVWTFCPGDDAQWSEPAFDDSGWRSVTLPAKWEDHSGYRDDYSFGWFRRTIEIPADYKGRDLILLLGRIDDADEVFLNGTRIGGTGAFPPNYATAWDADRRYRVPAALAKCDGSDVLAVRVYDGVNAGGIYAAGNAAERRGPFDPAESPSKHFTGNTVGGIGWYRKHFSVEEAGRHVSVLFDGVYMNAEVWINGHRLGEHPYGYTAFEFDLTPWLNAPGEENVLAVKVRNEGRNSRWYSGSGIYRHVTLSVTDPVYIPWGGVLVTTPEVSARQALVKLSCEVENSSDREQKTGVVFHILDAAGREVGTAAAKLTLPANRKGAVEQTVKVKKPALWSVDSPSLYTVQVEIGYDGESADVVSVPFGIRSLEFSAKKGFLLNGEPVLLKGGCIHHDNGALGAAAIDRAEERKIELLKASGYNAIRSAHNPPSSALLDACDRLGMLVIDEAFDQWKESKEHNAQDYHRFFDLWCEEDIAAMVRRDRNHPSVIMWSIGNEIPEQYRAESTQLRLRQAVLEHDTTRPVTQALCNYAHENTEPGFKHLDVCGYNYLPDDYEKDHERFPERVMFGSESFPKDALKYWAAVEEHPYVIGDFVWTAMDYLGEAGLAHAIWSGEDNPFFMPWPWIGSWSGDLDLCGFKKAPSFYRDVVWGCSELEMLVHEPIPEGRHEVLSWWAWPREEVSWNWAGDEGHPLQVAVYSRCETVRLELNGEIIGEQPVADLKAVFEVPYAEGTLKAYGMRGGKTVAEKTLQTAGAPAAIRLTADRTLIRHDRNDLAYVTVEVVDADGRRVPTAEVNVKFSVEGVGELAGQTSGSPDKPASFKAPECTTMNGRCIAILRPTGASGEMVLCAEAADLVPAQVNVSCAAAE